MAQCTNIGTKNSLMVKEKEEGAQIRDDIIPKKGGDEKLEL